MPHERALVLLRDVRDAATHVADLVARSGAALTDDWIERSALCWQLLVIGEACARLRRVAPDAAVQLPELPRAVGLRNLLAHGYDSIDDRDLFNVAAVHLPILLERVNRLSEDLSVSEG